MPVEIKMIAGAFLTIGITGAVICIASHEFVGSLWYIAITIIAVWVIFKK
jgi:hypothetical protein